MKKIIILIISLIFSATIPNSILAVEPPQPPPINSDNYKLSGTLKWSLNGNTLTNEADARDMGTGAPLSPALQINYSLAATGKILDYSGYTPPVISEPGAPLPAGPEPKIYEGVTLYSLNRNTNNYAFTSFPYDSIYYAEIYQGKVVDIIYADNNGELILETKDGSHRQYTKTKAPNISEKESKNLWVTRYLNAEVPTIRSQKPSPSGNTTNRGDCESEMQRLVNDIDSFRGTLYTFALNGCKDNVAEKCRSWHLYFRGKASTEIISDDMKPYQEAFKQMKGLDLPGFVLALMGEYEVESLIFEPAGIAMLDQLGTQAKSVKDTAAYLENNCGDFIDVKKTPGTYPRYLRKYDPNATTQQLINNWEEMKKVVNEVSTMAVLAKQNPTTTVSGPLADWENSVLKKVVCWLANAFISVLYWESNLAAFFLRRNY